METSTPVKAKAAANIGNIYIVSSPLINGLKIGLSSMTIPELIERYRTPYGGILTARTFRSTNLREHEKIIHDKLKNYRICGECFIVQALDEAIAVCSTITGSGMITTDHSVIANKIFKLSIKSDLVKYYQRAVESHNIDADNILNYVHRRISEGCIPRDSLVELIYGIYDIHKITYDFSEYKKLNIIDIYLNYRAIEFARFHDITLHKAFTDIARYNKVYIARELINLCGFPGPHCNYPISESKFNSYDSKRNNWASNNHKFVEESFKMALFKPSMKDEISFIDAVNYILKKVFNIEIIYDHKNPEEPYGISHRANNRLFNSIDCKISLTTFNFTNQKS